MKKMWMLLLAVSGLNFAMAQSGLRFIERDHDFGLIKEEDGDAEFTFKMINETADSVMITNVDASCGCTTPGWSRAMVAPGDTAYVQASYNPINRPGAFSKNLDITVKTDGKFVSEVVYIRGDVKPKPQTVSDALPVLMGNIRLKYKSLNMDKITTEGPVVRRFEVYNESDADVSWLPEKSVLPSYIKIDFEPKILPAHRHGEIVVTYDVVAKNDLGFVSDNIHLETNEAAEPQKDLHVIATISEFFPAMTDDQLANAPKLVLDKSQYDFGAVRNGAHATVKFTVYNSGKEKLEIRKVKSNCECAVAKLSSYEIKPGKSVEMEVSFDTTGRKGRQYKTLTVFSNDPRSPSQVVSLKAEVSE